ncbi:cell envelope integrity protein TolA [Caldimonas thermodepolymerans]|jgi:TolA protein|uniref:Protein TolA n=1 Tax=Caldimonas thermodepolymerans TaxID=215580 RepID=A0A2S5T9I9_9BURK|nr:cell envelope integrity protein TolA [Caldimonas thermodepolymerans]PPE71616.1 protein TolA [Caldimonas thermodepolymerans]RDI02753.1 cell division and transport-associated protein TolA [Caldimonas thermodepolymerans]UZG43377.1 cell envelope integrity protein TolA [Caldimonas thermodepolymerans]
MNPSTYSRDDLMPRAPDRRGRGLLLALLMHALLVLGLALGVNWKSSEPDAVEAELWAAVPQAAAPAPPPPPPPPVVEEKPTPPAPPVQREEPDRAAEIALEKERERKKEEQRQREEAEQRKREEEQRRLAEEKRKQEEAEKRRQAELRKQEEQRKAREEAERKRLAAEQEQRLQAQREERLKRLMSQAASGVQDTGAAQGGAAGSPSPSYAGKLKAAIRPHIVFTDTSVANIVAEVEVRAAPDGTILSSRLTKSSGNAEWDDAVLRAIEKAQKLPRDDNGRVPSPIEITFRPRDM